VPSAIQKAAAASGISVHTLRTRIRDKGMSLEQAVACGHQPGKARPGPTWPLSHEAAERQAAMRAWPRPPEAA
jgi:hypothetical protein